jgi:hypothetical protein
MGLNVAAKLLASCIRYFIVWTPTIFFSNSLYIKPNIVVEWLIFMPRIREVPGSNFGPGQETLTEIFRGFLQSLQANAGIVPDN